MMLVTLVHVRVRPEHVEAFVDPTRANHEGSVREPGNLRFDVLRAADDPTLFVLYEAYVDEAGARAHKETPHYLVWRETVADWMAEPRRGVTPSSDCSRKSRGGDGLMPLARSTVEAECWRGRGDRL